MKDGDGFTARSREIGILFAVLFHVSLRERKGLVRASGQKPVISEMMPKWQLRSIMLLHSSRRLLPSMAMDARSVQIITAEVRFCQVACWRSNP